MRGARGVCDLQTKGGCVAERATRLLTLLLEHVPKVLAGVIRDYDANIGWEKIRWERNSAHEMLRLCDECLLPPCLMCRQRFVVYRSINCVWQRYTRWVS